MREETIMKKTIISALALMLGVLGFSGCTKTDDNISVEVNGGKTITFVAEMDSRTIMTGEKPNFSTNWVVGDKVGLYSFNTEYDNEDGSHSQKNYNRNRTFTVESVSNGVATMTGTTYNSASSTGTHMFYGYYPCVENAKDEYTAVNMNIPSVQNMPVSETATFDPAANIMVAKPMSVNLNAPNLTFNNIRFRHTVAFINLSTKAISADGVSVDEIVSSVKFEAVGISENPTLAGDFQFNLEDGTMTFTKSESAVTVNVPDNTKLSDLSAWIVTNPFELTANDKLVITITTDAHTIIKNVSIAKNFEAANVYTLNLTIDNMCEIQKDAVYELVTDASTLAEGDQVIIVSATSNNAISTTQNKNNRPGVVVEVDNITKTVTIPANVTGVQILTVEVESNNETSIYLFNIGNKYLKSGNANAQLLEDELLSDNCKWNISIEKSTGVATITSSVTGEYKILKYNTNGYFSCYKPTSKGIENVKIYRLQDDRTPLTQPTITVTKDDSAKSIKVTWEAVSNATSYVVSCTGQTEQTFNAAGEYTFTGLEYGKKYTVTVTASADGYRSSSASEEGIEIIDYNLAKPVLASVTGTTEKISASWTAVPRATAYAWELYKGADKETGTLVKNGTYTPAADAKTVTLTIEGSFTAGEQYVLYVKSTADAPFVESAPAKSEVFDIKEAGAEKRTKLTNTNIVSVYDSSNTGYRDIELTDDNKFIYKAYAICNQHSKTTSNYKFLQIKGGTGYYIELPNLDSSIKKITMTVSGASQAMDKGGCTATLYFSSDKNTANAVASASGASSITIDMPNNNLTQGYILASGAVRIWDIEIVY